MIRQLLLLALAGALGTLARYGLSGFVQARLVATFPLGTVIVNVLGCFFFGLIWAYGTKFGILRQEWLLPALTGFLGAFTTFSTYMFESDQLLKNAEYTALALYALGQLAAGLTALRCGMMLGKAVL